ncbi:hypothetical protein EBT31_04185 [bacterium]|nr:hypothetical protein [bacterium]
MDLRMQRSHVGNPLEALRRAGYFPFRDPQSGAQSFVCRLGPDFYPRFHLYLKENDATITLSLHLDQKKASYGGAHMHNGEYEGVQVEKEMERIQGWILHMQEELQKQRYADAQNRDEEKKPWWKIW